MLYNEERPLNFINLKGQNANKEIFRNQIETGKFSGAYLFAGKHGSGKTTSARIMARAAVCEHPVNGGPCMQCEACLNFDHSPDIVEIDAASNTGVDAVREKMIESINLRPMQMKKKIYIWDEVHMFSTSAFNALLKTLEELPETAMIFLCTTELHKVPATIVSRCQKFIFSAIPFQEIKKHVLEVSKKHEICIDEKAADVIAKAADGSMRDALSILEQASAEEHITASFVSKMIGMGDIEIIDRTLDEVKNCNMNGVFQGIDDFLGYSSLSHLIDSLMERILERVAEGDSQTFLSLVERLSRIRGKTVTVTALKAEFYICTMKQEENPLIKRVAELEEKVRHLENAKQVQWKNFVGSELIMGKSVVYSDEGRAPMDLYLQVDNQDVVMEVTNHDGDTWELRQNRDKFLDNIKDLVEPGLQQNAHYNQEKEPEGVGSVEEELKNLGFSDISYGECPFEGSDVLTEEDTGENGSKKQNKNTHSTGTPWDW